MSNSRRVWAVVAAILLSVCCSWTALALDAAQRCTVNKLKAAARYSACRLKTESKARAIGEDADYTRCNLKLRVKWERIEAKAGGLCPVAGDVVAIEGQATGDADALVAAIAGEPLPPYCGDGTADVGEDCDQGDLAGEDCETQGFAGGALACGGGCVFDTSGCYAVRFVDNLDGTITDYKTGLMWEKKILLDAAAVDCPSATDCPNPHDADNRYTWTTNAANPIFDGTASSVFLAQLNDVTGGGASCFAGHCDWRLPKREELVMLLDYSRNRPSIDPAFHGANCGPGCGDLADPSCSCTYHTVGVGGYFYWTSDTNVGGVRFALNVSFVDGDIFDNDKVIFNQARAVRAAP